MFVAAVKLHLRIEGAHSLKDKRRVLRSVLDRARRDLNLSVAEVDDHDLWNVATVGACAVSGSRPVAVQSVRRLADMVAGDGEVVVEAEESEVLAIP
ncbi:MAG: DUF503 domain-containing protein [Fimbriimonadaceae bacterium]|nr:DUF503 domain-containing protein [Fimbriimonadaceae bacterium]